MILKSFCKECGKMLDLEKSQLIVKKHNNDFK